MGAGSAGVSDIKRLFQAVQEGDRATVKSLLEAQPALAAAKNEQGLSAVMAAVYSGRNQIRDLLVEHGAAREAHEAAATGQVGRLQELLEKDPGLATLYSPDGFPVVALTAAFGHAAAAKYLVAKGADVNAVATNGSGYTALTGAVTGGHTEIVAWLLTKGASVNHRYGPGYSPLLAAAANGHLEIVKMLLEHGADPLAKANDGQTALSLAETRGHAQLAEFLRGR
jgi:ankyrin repeat protein